MGYALLCTDVAAAAHEQCLHTYVILYLLGETDVVTESLFQIDEPNADKDASAPVAGEYVKRYGKYRVVSSCG